MDFSWSPAKTAVRPASIVAGGAHWALQRAPRRPRKTLSFIFAHHRHKKVSSMGFYTKWYINVLSMAGRNQPTAGGKNKTLEIPYVGQVLQRLAGSLLWCRLTVSTPGPEDTMNHSLPATRGGIVWARPAPHCALMLAASDDRAGELHPLCRVAPSARNQTYFYREVLY
jgi:hypothetical protein